MAIRKTTLASNKVVPITVASKQLKGKVGIIHGFYQWNLVWTFHVRLQQAPDRTSCSIVRDVPRIYRECVHRGRVWGSDDFQFCRFGKTGRNNRDDRNGCIGIGQLNIPRSTPAFSIIIGKIPC